MPPTIRIRIDYVREGQQLFRLREALRKDPRISEALRDEARSAAGTLMKLLLEIDEALIQSGQSEEKEN